MRPGGEGYEVQVESALSLQQNRPFASLQAIDAIPVPTLGLVQRIGTVFQEPEHQFLTPSVGEELEFGPRRVGVADPRRTAELAERLRLTHLLRANPFTLSGGEKRRLSVATMLATAPRILILDEPTFGQDALTWAELVTLLLELIDDGVAVVSVTHDADFIAALGGATLHVSGGAGRLVAR